MVSIRTAVLTVAMVCVLGMVPAGWAAETIVGPSLPGNESGHINHGIVFTSLDFVRLLGFDFNNQGKADQIQLVNQSQVIHTLATPAGQTVYTAVVDWLLAPGTYQLLGTTTSNSKFGSFNFPATNSHISVTSGIFSNNGGQANWADFRNIITEQAQGPPSEAIPEPTTSALIAAAMLALFFMQRKVRSLQAK